MWVALCANWYGVQIGSLCVQIGMVCKLVCVQIGPWLLHGKQQQVGRFILFLLQW